MKAMEEAHKAHTETMFSNKIKEALKRKIRAQQQVFYPNDKVYYKRDQILGPGGHVYYIKVQQWCLEKEDKFIGLFIKTKS